MPNYLSLTLGELAEVRQAPVENCKHLLCIEKSASRGLRILPGPVSNRVDPSACQGLWLLPGPQCGDAPGLYHPLYLAAVLSSQSALRNIPCDEHYIKKCEIPVIAFGTPEETRRSMTLNGMRMTTEWIQTGSQRVLQLVSNRIEAGQRDVAHDVLVYLMSRILDVRAEESEARALRAEAIAAYLGLEQARVEPLFRSRLAASNIARQIQGGVAGPVRRTIEIEPLIASQIALLRPQLAALKAREKHLMQPLDEIVEMLFA
ncbi:MAG TPA: hypothetical protein VF719_09975 [Abditibacteriaceae bacterium]|jgi:hypothetical protein